MRSNTITGLCKQAICVFIVVIIWGCSYPPVVDTSDGFKKALKVKTSNSNYRCHTSIPYTGPLEFPSKYDGSGKARDKINEHSEAKYNQLTKQINDFSYSISKLSNKLYRNKGSQAEYACLLQNLVNWAEQESLLGHANGTGQAIRKWNLAALSTHYLKLQSLHASQQEDTFVQQREVIAHWLSALADTVIKDYSDKPIEKINNHNYWAAWAVMATSAVTQSPAQYQWAKQQFNIAIEQINEDGLWPNELRRGSRAFQYHNYAVAPVAATASFLQTNGDLQNGVPLALRTLVRHVIVGVESDALFQSTTGKRQVEYDVTEKGRLAWLPIYLSLSNDPLAELIYRRYPPQSSTRLGGNTTQLFLPLPPQT